MPESLYPHEEYICLLFRQGKSRLEVSQILSENELAIPPVSTLETINIESNNNIYMCCNFRYGFRLRLTSYKAIY